MTDVLQKNVLKIASGTTGICKSCAGYGMGYIMADYKWILSPSGTTMRDINTAKHLNLSSSPERPFTEDEQLPSMKLYGPHVLLYMLHWVALCAYAQFQWNVTEPLDVSK